MRMITTQLCKICEIKNSLERKPTMQIRKEDIDKLKALNDTQLRDAIGQIADALGANPSQKRRAQNNVGYIRRKLGDGKKNDIMC